MSQANSNITITRGQITVDNVSPDKYKGDKGIFSAQLRQEVTKTYPSVQVKTGGLFDAADFNLPEGKSYTSTRVSWVHVPEGTTVEQVAEKIAANQGATIYQLISNNLDDVLTEGQKYAMQAGLRTREEFADQLLVRDTDGNDLEVVMYSQNFFSATPHADMDNRTVRSANAAGTPEKVGDAFNGVEKAVVASI